MGILNFLGTVWDFFGFFWKFFRNSLGFLRDIFGDLLRNILKIVILGEFLGNMKRIDLFVKILVFVKILSKSRRKEGNFLDP